MAPTELAALEATVAKLTARSPSKLYRVDGEQARERLEAELEGELARLDDPELSESDTDTYLHEYVLDSDDGDDIVVTDAYPRNAGMASGIYQALKALRLPSGGAVYYQAGEWERELKAVAGVAMDDQAAATFGEVIALPTYFYAGGILLEIDEHLTACTPGGWMFDELVDHEADWIPQEQLDEGEERRAELQRAINESEQEADTGPDQLSRAQETLDATPPWFFRLTDNQLEGIAAYPHPEPGQTPRLRHTFHDWTKPTAEMFLRPRERVNLQHIVAAYLLAR
jgi:hypothetical protein